MNRVSLIVLLSGSLAACTGVTAETSDTGDGTEGAGGDTTTAATTSTSASSGQTSAASTSTTTAAATSTGSGQNATSGDVSFLCYNVHGLPAVVTGDNTGGRMTAIAPLLNTFDVVAVQEDFMPGHHATLIGASIHPSQQWFDQKVDPTRIYGAGLSVFGAPTQIDQHEEHFAACNGVFDGANDCLSSKGFQMVRMELAPGAEVDVYNTHLDAGGGSGDDDARAAQVDQLLAAFTTISAGRAIVVMGDLNLEEDDPNEAPTLFHLIDDGMLTDSCDAVACDEPGRIERILFRGSDSLALTIVAWVNEPAFENGGDPLSDHPAISATFAWQLTR